MNTYDLQIKCKYKLKFDFFFFLRSSGDAACDRR